MKILNDGDIFKELYHEEWESYRQKLNGRDAQKISSYVNSDYLVIAKAQDKDTMRQVGVLLDGMENPTDKPVANRRYTDALDQQEDACYATWEAAIQAVKTRLGI